MKTIGVIGAMQEEVELLQKTTGTVAVKNVAGMDFYVGTYKSKETVTVKSGIGKVNAAIAAQILIDIFGVDCIINTGVAGAISKELGIGDVVISTDAVHHDFSTPGDPCGYIPRMDKQFFEADPELISTAKTAGEMYCKNKVFTGRIASGDQFISTIEQKNFISTNFKAMCAEMEGAAVAHTAYINNVPFVIIRSVSDSADGSAASDYSAFEKESAVIASEIVLNMIEQIQ
jgi:adenosylhomocysteine nucleosidase